MNSGRIVFDTVFWQNHVAAAKYLLMWCMCLWFMVVHVLVDCMTIVSPRDLNLLGDLVHMDSVGTEVIGYLSSAKLTGASVFKQHDRRFTHF